MNEYMNIQKESFCDFGSQREMKSVSTLFVDCYNTMTLIATRLLLFKGIHHEEISNYKVFPWYTTTESE